MLITPELILFFLLIIMGIVCFTIVCVSVYKHKEEICFWRALAREDGKPSKIAITFWFVLPIILYQSIMTGTITPGLIEIMYVVFGAELGVKGIDIFSKRKSFNGSRSDYYEDTQTRTTNSRSYMRE